MTQVRSSKDAVSIRVYTSTTASYCSFINEQCDGAATLRSLSEVVFLVQSSVLSPLRPCPRPSHNWLSLAEDDVKSTLPKAPLTVRGGLVFIEGVQGLPVISVEYLMTTAPDACVDLSACLGWPQAYRQMSVRRFYHQFGWCRESRSEPGCKNGNCERRNAWCMSIKVVSDLSPFQMECVDADDAA